MMPRSWHTRGVVGRIIETEDCIAEGLDYLAEIEPRFADAREIVERVPLRRRKDGFETLLDAIVSQQLSVAAADTIWKRMRKAKLTGPRQILRASEDELRACGLSRPKARYARELAASGIRFSSLRGLPDHEVLEVLTAVKGVGVWTAEIYLMFALGRANAFAAGDLALQEGARMLFDLDERPKERELRGMAEPWAPWRSVAARLLWSYYAAAKTREGVR